MSMKGLRVYVLGAPDAAGTLREQGVEVLDAPLEEAQDAMRPDAAILDAAAGDFEGTLRRLAREEAVPVVVVADHAASDDMRRALVAGARDYLVRPLAAAELIQALAAVCRGRAESAQPAQLVAVAGARGGAGRTVLAAHLAAALARMDERVTAVDLDLELGNLAESLGVSPRVGIGDLARATGEVSPAMVDALCMPVPGMGMRVLAGPRHPAEASRCAGRAGAALEGLAGECDWLVVDLARDLGEATLAALDRATVVLLVVAPDPSALTTTVRLRRLLSDELHYTPERLRLVCNRTTPRPALNPRAVAETLGTLDVTFLPFDPEVPLAQAAGRPLTARRRRSAYGDAVSVLCAQLVGQTRPARQGGGGERAPRTA